MGCGIDASAREAASSKPKPRRTRCCAQGGRWNGRQRQALDTDRGLHDPVCRLVLSLYGHPDAGGYWEKHCDQVLKNSDGKKVFAPIEEKGGISLMMSDSSNFSLLIQFVIALFQIMMRTSFGRMFVKYILFLEYYLRTWFNKT